MKFVLAILSFLISAQAFAQSTLVPLTQDEVQLLDSVVRNCSTSHMEYQGDQKSVAQSDFQISTAQTAASDGGYTHIYTQQMWDAIKAAATQLKELGWVVTDSYYADSRLKNRVLTSEQYEQLKKEHEKTVCMIGPDPIPMCGDDERRIARELFGFENLSPCGDEKPWDREHPNAIRDQHVHMIQALLDQGYSYNEATRTFEKSAAGDGGEQKAQGLR